MEEDDEKKGSKIYIERERERKRTSYSRFLIPLGIFVAT